MTPRKRAPLRGFDRIDEVLGRFFAKALQAQNVGLCQPEKIAVLNDKLLVNELLDDFLAGAIKVTHPDFRYQPID